MLIEDRRWFAWSREQLARARAESQLVTGPIVLAELTRYAGSADGLRLLAESLGARIESWTLAASFAAGKAFEAYRGRGGGRNVILADLLTGGHAAVLGAQVLTRDPRRFRAYFPDLALLSPGEDD